MLSCDSRLSRSSIDTTKYGITLAVIAYCRFFTAMVTSQVCILIIFRQLSGRCVVANLLVQIQQ